MDSDFEHSQSAVAAGRGNRKLSSRLRRRCPPNPAGIQVLYTTIEGTGTAADPFGVFESTDQGANWTQQTAIGLGSCQCNFTMQMSVDPASPGDGINDILLWGGTNESGLQILALTLQT